MTDSIVRRAAPRIGFIPVSGRFGMGEYARSLAIAHAARAQWPEAEIHFMVSSEAPYAKQVPFPVTVLPSSPTFHSPMVIAWMQEWRPTLLVFDNAGRTQQLRAAQRLGAKIVYISARRRQRRKAFRLGWMRMIDEHWIAYPAFIAGQLSWLERLKLRLVGRPAVRYLDVILSRGAAARGAELLATLALQSGAFVLMVPGGGTGHPGAREANAQFLLAARALAAQGVPTLFVGPALPADVATEPMPAARETLLQTLGAQPQAELAQLMRHARVVVANGGSTLLQALAFDKPCVAVGIANDQTARIASCVAAGVAVAAAAQAEPMAALAMRLWSEPATRADMSRRTQALELADGVAVATAAMHRLIDGEA